MRATAVSVISGAGPLGQQRGGAAPHPLWPAPASWQGGLRTPGSGGKFQGGKKLLSWTWSQTGRGVGGGTWGPSPGLPSFSFLGEDGLMSLTPSSFSGQ